MNPQITQSTPTLTRSVLAALRGICIVHGPYFEAGPCPGCLPRYRSVRSDRDPLGPTAIAEFCLRVAKKRFERFQSTKIDGSTSCEAGRVARLAARHFLPEEKAAPNFIGKEKSALAKDPKEYAAKLQRLPDRLAAIVTKTVAVKGDAFELDDAVALIHILDLINELDHTLIERNANKKLARSRRSS